MGLIVLCAHSGQCPLGACSRLCLHIYILALTPPPPQQTLAGVLVDFCACPFLSSPLLTPDWGLPQAAGAFLGLVSVSQHHRDTTVRVSLAFRVPRKPFCLIPSPVLGPSLLKTMLHYLPPREAFAVRCPWRVFWPGPQSGIKRGGKTERFTPQVAATVEAEPI